MRRARTCPTWLGSTNRHCLPPKKLPRCTTCTHCRGPTCRKHGKCKKPIETLPTKNLPATAEDAQNFACARCRYVRCIVRHEEVHCRADLISEMRFYRDRDLKRLSMARGSDLRATFLSNTAAMTIPKAIAFLLVPLLLPATTVLSPLNLEICAGKVSFSG